MRMVSNRALAFVAVSSLMLACGSETTPPRPGVTPIGSTPPAMPVALPPPPIVPPTTGGTVGGGGGGAGGSTRTPDAGSIPDAPPAAVCLLTVPAMGNDGLIDDFNDNNPEIRLVDGRLGNWATYKSATSMVTNQMLEGVPEFPLVVMGMGMMNRGLRFRGTEPLETSQWAGEVVATVTPDCYDASIYRGVQLQIRGLPNTRVEVMLLTASVRAQNMPDQIGGHYHSPVTITSATVFQTVTILWNQFLPGWGVTPGPNVDPKLVYGLAVLPALRPAANDAGTATSIGQFDFTIDNVRFLAPMP